MNIRAKLTLQFSVIVGTILVLFSLVVYLLSAEYRREEFFTRLESRAITTARLLVKVKEVDLNTLRIIDQNSIHALFQEKVLIFDQNDSLLYSSLDDLSIGYSHDLLEKIRREKRVAYAKDQLETIGLVFPEQGDDENKVVVISSAFDRYGRSKLNNLRNVLLTGLFIGIGLIIIAGRFFAGQMLAPLVRINAQISEITAGNLNRRVDEGNRRDEFAQLAMNFNQMLKRLETAFEIQQQFVSNASHELRTPLAAITSQLQVTLDKPRSMEEYQRVMKSVFDDARTLVELTNGLLVLAQSSIQHSKVPFGPLRIDEVLYAAKDELARAHPEYHFQIEYLELPEEEEAMLIFGNEQLLKTTFLNLMDNACKFSTDQQVKVSISLPGRQVEIRFSDRGIGVPAGEEEKIFNSFFRGSNVSGTTRGYGIGLSLSRRIMQLHQGSIRLQNRAEGGSEFIVTLPVIH